MDVLQDLELRFKGLDVNQKSELFWKEMDKMKSTNVMIQVTSTEETESYNRRKQEMAALLQFQQKHQIANVDIDQRATEILSNPIGCNYDHHQLDLLLCGNVDVARNKNCDRKATKICSGCDVISYCSKDCQTAHWRLAHKAECKQGFNSPEWVPRFIQEGRDPAFMSYDSSSSTTGPFGSSCEYLWGNTLPFNLAEGLEDSSVDLLFGASGDLRNTLTTLANLDSKIKTARIVLNDMNPRVVMRNFMLMLYLLKYGEDAIDFVCQYWYSTCLTSNQYMHLLFLLRDTVKPEDDQILFSRNGASIHLKSRIVIQCLQRTLADRCDLQELLQKRKVVMLHPSRVDHRDRRMQKLNAGERVAFDIFRHHGNTRSN